MRSLMSRQMLLPHERPVASSHCAREATVGAVIGIHVDPCFQMNTRKKNNGERDCGIRGDARPVFVTGIRNVH